MFTGALRLGLACACLIGLAWAAGRMRESTDVVLDPIVVSSPEEACTVISGPLEWEDGRSEWYSVLCPIGVEPK